MDDSNRPWLFASSIESETQTGDSNWVPKIGMEFENVEDAWNFWTIYGAQMGFGVRKLWVNTSKKDGNISSTRFVCNKEGARRKDKRDHLTKYGRAETRTNCLVRMGITYSKEIGKYTVHDFVDQHNHQLHLPETIHMIPSQRKILDVQAAEIDMAFESGIKSKASYELMSRHSGGRASIGYTLQDQKNYLRTKRQRNMIYGEAGTLLKYFQQQLIDNPSFYYAVQLDNEEQITNIFWADAKMLIDYAYFGDVVTFDTTYRTNKECRPFGVFVGLNHHREIVIFGATLLYDETTESFEWLFRTFLEAQKEKRPKCIFTDQDHAMGRALQTVMPDIYHGLCTWHIMQNAIKNLGNLLKDESNLLKDFKACMYEYEEEKMFEREWKHMIAHYQVEDNFWLKNIYKVKEQWAKCYMRNVCTLGVRSTQLSESLNGDLKDYLRSDLDIIQFFNHFERVVEDKRYKELKAEYNSRQKLPQLGMIKSPLLLQASKIYTPTIFKLFQEEYEMSLAAVVKDRKENQQMNEYFIGIFDRDEEYKVQGSPSEKVVLCSCNKFEVYGFLCWHALKVLDVMDVKLIPDQYVVKRWTRDARSENVADVDGRIMRGDMKLDSTRRYRLLCSKMVKLASRASENEESYRMIDKAIDDLTSQVVMLGTNTSDGDNQPTCPSLSNNEKTVELDNLFERVKGLKKKTGQKGRKRLKSWVEKQKRRKGKASSLNGSKNSLQKDILETDSLEWMGCNANDMNSNSPNQAPKAGIDGSMQHCGSSYICSSFNNNHSTNFSELLMAMDTENSSNYMQFFPNWNDLGSMNNLQ